MSVSRTGTGPVAATRALASQVHPVFMLPAVATAVFGGLLADAVTPGHMALHVLAVALGLYTAHVIDGVVDFYVRNEDEDHPLSRRGCNVAMWGASAAFWVLALGLGLLVGPGAFLLTAPGWFIAISHAPQLDTNPLGATVGYPGGVTLALLGGFYVQAGRLSAPVVALAGIFLVVLAGIKVIDDTQDLTYDAGIGKRTVPVVLGRGRARLVAFGLLGLGSGAVVWVALFLRGIPPSAGLAALPFLMVAALAARAGPELATMLLVRGSYLFLAVLVAAVWFEPLA